MTLPQYKRETVPSFYRALEAAKVEYQVNEMFYSIQGEGEHVGYTAVFIRLQGCPVGCTWCDSKLTWYAGGTKNTVQQIIDGIKALPDSRLLIITGGEPLIYNLDALMEGLYAVFPQRFVHLETSGAYPFKGVQRPDWITLSPKAAAGWKVDENVLTYADELKYVVDEVFDEGVVRGHILQLPVARLNIAVRLMPEGSPPRKEMVEKTLAVLMKHPDWRFSPRLQYDYAPVGALEGHNNKKITAEEARSATPNPRNRKRTDKPGRTPKSASDRSGPGPAPNTGS